MGTMGMCQKLSPNLAEFSQPRTTQRVLTHGHMIELFIGHGFNSKLFKATGGASDNPQFVSLA
jgi:hypothetical protein